MLIHDPKSTVSLAFRSRQELGAEGHGTQTDSGRIENCVRKRRRCFFGAGRGQPIGEAWPRENIGGLPGRAIKLRAEARPDSNPASGVGQPAIPDVTAQQARNG